MATTNTLTPSPHVEAAKALLDKIRGLRADVPSFTPHVPSEVPKLLQKSIVPDDALEASSVAVQMFTRLEEATKADAATLRNAYGYALAYDPVVKELFAFARSVAYTIRVQRAEAGESALDIYAAATRFSKKKDGAEFIPYVQDMKAKLARLRRPRKATLSPAPAPDATTAPSKTV
ncbi:MAG TPA: hypothetical protein VKB93_09915 [Thermoanaerobaculia bacterium]|nr:hypothetical protein [Thermoanaerobaculia bacterium]